MWPFKKRNRVIIKGLGRAGVQYSEADKVLHINAEFSSTPLTVVIDGKSKFKCKPGCSEENISDAERELILIRVVDHFEGLGYIVDLRR